MRRIPDIQQVCLLRNAVLSPDQRAAAVCIEYPPKSGVQPALLIANGKTGAERMVDDAIAILPPDPLHYPPLRSIYCNYLGLVAHASQRRITRMRNEFIKGWEIAGRNEFPFCAPSLDLILEELRKSLRGSAEVRSAEQVIVATGGMGAGISHRGAARASLSGAKGT